MNKFQAGDRVYLYPEPPTFRDFWGDAGTIVEYSSRVSQYYVRFDKGTVTERTLGAREVNVPGDRLGFVQGRQQVLFT